MSEKRFIKLKSEWVDINFPIIWDTCNETGLNVEQAVNVLNEQQSIIDKLDQENADLLGARIKAQEEWEKCTDKLKEKILEQQATIRRLQDLCGESDRENAKLRIENKKLKAKLKEKEEDERLYANEIVELRKTNEEWLQFKELGGDY